MDRSYVLPCQKTGFNKETDCSSCQNPNNPDCPSHSHGVE